MVVAFKFNVKIPNGSSAVINEGLIMTVCTNALYLFPGLLADIILIVSRIFIVFLGRALKIILAFSVYPVMDIWTVNWQEVVGSYNFPLKSKKNFRLIETLIIGRVNSDLRIFPVKFVARMNNNVAIKTEGQIWFSSQDSIQLWALCGNECGCWYFGRYLLVDGTDIWGHCSLFNILIE